MQAAVEEFATLHEKIRKSYEEDIRIAAASMEALPKIAVEGIAKRAISDAIRLAECGWTTPNWLTIREHHELAELSCQELDDAFREMYFSDNRSRLVCVRSTLHSDPSTEKWRNLIDQLFNCFDRNEHVIAIPALFVLLEALVAEYLAKGSELINKIGRAHV